MAEETNVSNETNYSEPNDNASFLAAVERSKKVEADILVNPKKYRVLTGDRPTGRLHIGHYFGSLQNRVRLQNLGVPTMILIADYQVLTDHDAFDKIAENTRQLAIDYLAAGIVPGDDVMIFPAFIYSRGEPAHASVPHPRVEFGAFAEPDGEG